LLALVNINTTETSQYIGKYIVLTQIWVEYGKPKFWLKN